MNIDFDKKVKDIISQKKEKHLQRLGNVIENGRFLLEKSRFEKEYTLLDKFLQKMIDTKDEYEKQKIYRELLIYLGSSKE